MWFTPRFDGSVSQGPMPTSARPPHPPKPPLGDQGEVARSAGGDQNRQKPGQTIPQSRFASQLPLHKGACPLRRKGGMRSAMVYPTRKCVPGGHTGRPYGPAPGLLVGAGFMPARNRVPISAGVPSAMVHPTRRYGSYRREPPKPPPREPPPRPDPPKPPPRLEPPKPPGRPPLWKEPGPGPGR